MNDEQVKTSNEKGAKYENINAVISLEQANAILPHFLPQAMHQEILNCPMWLT